MQSATAALVSPLPPQQELLRGEGLVLIGDSSWIFMHAFPDESPIPVPDTHSGGRCPLEPLICPTCSMSRAGKPSNFFFFLAFFPITSFSQDVVSQFLSPLYHEKNLRPSTVVVCYAAIKDPSFVVSS